MTDRERHAEGLKTNEDGEIKIKSLYFETLYIQNSFTSSSS